MHNPNPTNDSQPSACRCCGPQISVFDLIGRAVVDEAGLECQITWVHLDGATGRLVMELSEIDEDGDVAWYSHDEIDSLEGWELVCHQ